MARNHGDGKELQSTPSPTPRLQVPTQDSHHLTMQGRRTGARRTESPPEPDEEIRRLASMITRQASRGFTGETWLVRLLELSLFLGA